jgi:RNase adaptor protein for sRNA GlmZ degradation
MSIPPIVIVIGKIGSGKTTLCDALKRFGYFHISASSILDKLRNYSNNSYYHRLELAEFGLHLRRSGELYKFDTMIISEAADHRRASIDGIRFLETLTAVKRGALECQVIYLLCADEVRRRRKAELSDEQWLQINSHETELSVEKMAACANLMIDSSADENVVLRQVVEALGL